MGEFVERLGNTNYIIDVGGMRLHRHVDQIIATTEPIETKVDVDTPPSPRENLVVEAPREVICKNSRIGRRGGRECNSFFGSCGRAWKGGS